MRPEHDRTSCSDDDLNNGFHSRGDGTWHGRCTRCMWLEIAKDEQDLPEGFNYEECEG
ncbi:hypothetical protein [Polaribacter sp.]|uniref:hypothetical protein n=1 Tax=Polaribacter sp. TaxID=1920175 RepID=UPI003F6B7CA4